MLYILGAGAAYPQNCISNDFLESVGRGLNARSILEETGISERGTVLSLDHIRATGNSEPFASNREIQPLTTELGYQAALRAVARAGIDPAQIGLVLGDSSTPIETTPSEGQRVANRFNLRCPAYDVFSSSGSFLLHLDSLFNWREEVLPDYILCVYSNAATTRVDYQNGCPRLHFGDAGAALVLSPRHPGKMQVAATHFEAHSAFSDILSVETLGHIEMRDDLIEEFIEPRTDEMFVKALAHAGLRTSDCKVIGTQISGVLLDELASRHGLRREQILQNVKNRGYAFSSSTPSVLADSWDALTCRDNIVIAEAGAGLSFGFATLNVLS